MSNVLIRTTEEDKKWTFTTEASWQFFFQLPLGMPLWSEPISNSPYHPDEIIQPFECIILSLKSCLLIIRCVFHIRFLLRENLHLYLIILGLLTALMIRWPVLADCAAVDLKWRCQARMQGGGGGLIVATTTKQKIVLKEANKQKVHPPPASHWTK